MVYEDISVSWKAVPLAVAHSAILTVAYLSIGFGPIRFSQSPLMIRNLILLLMLVAAVPIYLKTGVPNVIKHGCEECGHKVKSGRLRCGSCDEILKSGYLGPQILWFAVGYSLLSVFFFFVLDTSLRFATLWIRGGIISPEYGYYTVLGVGAHPYSVALIQYSIATFFWVFILVASYVVRKVYIAVQTEDV